MGDRLLAPDDPQLAAGPAPSNDGGKPPDLKTPPADAPTPLGWGVAIGAFLVICACVPELESTAAPAKAAMLLILGAAGLPFLVLRAVGRGPSVRARSETWAARAAVAFLVAAAISTAVSIRPVLAVVGLYSQFTGLLFLVALGGCWAIGTGLKAADRRLLESALIGAALVNAVVAILQQLVGLGGIGIPDYNDLPDGLMGNPVYLGAILAAGLVLLAPRYRHSRRQHWLAVALAGLGLGVCSERLSSLLALVVVACELWFAFRSTPPASANRLGHHPPGARRLSSPCSRSAGSWSAR